MITTNSVVFSNKAQTIGCCIVHIYTEVFFSSELKGGIIRNVIQSFRYPNNLSS